MIVDQLVLKSSKAEKTEQDDKLLRSVIKSVSWRIIGTLDTIFISYMITGSIKPALSIGAIELVTKMTLYVIHERLWNKIQWGK